MGSGKKDDSSISIFFILQTAKRNLLMLLIILSSYMHDMIAIEFVCESSIASIIFPEYFSKKAFFPTPGLPPPILPL